MGFSYVPYNDPDAAADITPAADVPHRAQVHPFATFVGVVDADEETTFDDTKSSRFARQCVPVERDLYGYEAFGGTGTVTHTVSVSYGMGDDMMTVYGSRPGDDPPVMGMGGPGNMGNGFELMTSDVPSEMLSGRPNLASGDYMWTLHAGDSVGQMVSRSWKFRVTDMAYVAPDGNDTPDDSEDPTVDGAPIEDWADFISSTFMPTEFGATETRLRAMSHMATEGAVKAVNLSPADNSGVGTITGIIEKDDIDAIWVGGLTPDVKLDVKYKGTTEGSTSHDFNEISVMLRRHVAGEGKQDAITADAMATKDYMATYSDLACGFYYLEIQGVDGDMGNYELSWKFAE